MFNRGFSQFSGLLRQRTFGKNTKFEVNISTVTVCVNIIYVALDPRHSSSVSENNFFLILSLN